MLAIDVNIEYLWNNESEREVQKQPLDHLRSVYELPVDDFLDCLLLEEIKVVLAVSEQVGEEKVINVVQFFSRPLLIPPQILSVFQRAWLPLHEPVHF